MLGYFKTAFHQHQAAQPLYDAGKLLFRAQQSQDVFGFDLCLTNATARATTGDAEQGNAVTIQQADILRDRPRPTISTSAMIQGAIRIVVRRLEWGIAV